LTQPTANPSPKPRKQLKTQTKKLPEIPHTRRIAHKHISGKDSLLGKFALLRFFTQLAQSPKPKLKI
jgi:hypothetical protein